MSARHKAFAEKYYENGKGRVQLAECPVCGWLTWNTTYQNEPASFYVVPLHYGCPMCVEVHQRNPELARWVLNVIAKQLDEKGKQP